MKSFETQYRSLLQEMDDFASKTTFPKFPPIILGDSQYVGSFYETGIQLGKNQKEISFRS